MAQQPGRTCANSRIDLGQNDHNVYRLRCILVLYMLWRKIPDPLLGPKEDRGLLVIRDFAAFIGLTGLYLSLEHLSVSDANILTFITPILLGFSGPAYLKESLSLREMLS
ncbi:hypothetical protein F5888DRAFT_511455 [Russula emetica]|nr:hypothetical protein F5888DRAFT_511455 [Russula emetica]